MTLEQAIVERLGESEFTDYLTRFHISDVLMIGGFWMVTSEELWEHWWREIPSEERLTMILNFILENVGAQ